MIQAGTISTGSGRTLSPTGSYWMSSIKRLRKIDLAGCDRERLAELERLHADGLAAVGGALASPPRSSRTLAPS